MYSFRTTSRAPSKKIEIQRVGVLGDDRSSLVFFASGLLYTGYCSDPCRCSVALSCLRAGRANVAGTVELLCLNLQHICFNSP